MCVCVCRSDPVLQRSQGHEVDGQRLSSGPPSDGHSVKPATDTDTGADTGSGLLRDGSIKNIVNCFENKVEEVTLYFHH